LQLLECLVGHGTQRPQGVIVRHSFFGRNIAPHFRLLRVVSSHDYVAITVRVWK